MSNKRAMEKRKRFLSSLVKAVWGNEGMKKGQSRGAYAENSELGRLGLLRWSEPAAAATRNGGESEVRSSVAGLSRRSPQDSSPKKTPQMRKLGLGIFCAHCQHSHSDQRKALPFSGVSGIGVLAMAVPCQQYTSTRTLSTPYAFIRSLLCSPYWLTVMSISKKISNKEVKVNLLWNKTPNHTDIVIHMLYLLAKMLQKRTGSKF